MLPLHYSRFRVSDRILLTGHSHQAWPDVGFEAQARAWLDAAEHVDDKWARAEEQAILVREGFARLLGDEAVNIALGQNTHELVARFLSALPLSTRPRIVTTDGEFGSLRRQLDRAREESWIEVVKVAARPAATLAGRLAAAIDTRTAAVAVSSVLFETAEIVPGLEEVASSCARHGAELLVDAYHHLNVVPFSLRGMQLQEAFVTGGGYKYCQLGEGNCFLRVPWGRRMRPVLTGWFAEFGELEDVPVRAESGHVRYPSGAPAFAGATYEPVSHYRAAAVFAFHREQKLTPDRLREINVRQVQMLRTLFEECRIDPRVAYIEPMPEDRRGGFLAIRSPRAQGIVRPLRHEQVWVDARGDILRVGPAPYVNDGQLEQGMAAVVRALSSP